MERPDLDVSTISDNLQNFVDNLNIDVETPDDDSIFEAFGGSVDDGSLNMDLDGIDDDELLN